LKVLNNEYSILAAVCNCEARSLRFAPVLSNESKKGGFGRDDPRSAGVKELTLGAGYNPGKKPSFFLENRADVG